MRDRVRVRVNYAPFFQMPPSYIYRALGKDIHGQTWVHYRGHSLAVRWQEGSKGVVRGGYYVAWGIYRGPFKQPISFREAEKEGYGKR